MKHQENAKLKTIIKHSIAGSITGILLLMVSAAILSTLILNGSIPERRINYFVLVLIMVSVFLGTITGGKSAGEYKKIVCLITGTAIFSSLLFVTAVLFGGRYAGVGETGLLILCGCVLPLLLKPNGRKKKKAGSQMVKLYKKL